MKIENYKHKSIFLVISIIIFFSNYSAIGAIWISGGPYGGYINKLDIAKTNPDIIYAGTDYGVFKTVDAGGTWADAGLPGKFVRVVRVDPVNPDIVYAGTDDDGIYKSVDGGSSWVRRGLSGARVNAIAIDPANPQILFAGTGGDIIGIFKSTDGGETWQQKLSGGGWNGVEDILIDTNDSSHIYAALGRMKVYKEGALGKSTDGGETWVRRHFASYGWDELWALAMTPAGVNPAVMYAIADSKVYKWTYGDERYTITNPPSMHPNSPYALTVDPTNPDVVYVGTSRHLYKTTNGTDTWSAKENGLNLGWPSSIVVDPRDGAVYAGLSEGGVYKSTDGAENWNFSSHGMGAYIEGLAKEEHRIWRKPPTEALHGFFWMVRQRQ